MKRLTLIISLISLYLIGFSKGNETYIVLENNPSLSDSKVTTAVTAENVVLDHILCKKITIGKIYSKITLENGSKLTLNTSDIKSYRINEKLFYKLPIYENNKNTNSMIFMQLVGIKGGYNLFKYSKFEEGMDKKTGAYHELSPVNYYLVFRGDQFAYEVTEKNYEEVFNKFGLPLVY